MCSIFHFIFKIIVLYLLVGYLILKACDKLTPTCHCPRGRIQNSVVILEALNSLSAHLLLCHSHVIVSLMALLLIPPAQTQEPAHGLKTLETKYNPGITPLMSS